MYIVFNKENNTESPKFKIGDMLKYQNIKLFLQKAMFQIGLKKFFWLKVKNTALWTYDINDPKGKEIVGTFHDKELQKKKKKKKIQKDFTVEK